MNGWMWIRGMKKGVVEVNHEEDEEGGEILFGM
jgi:hypothetical protein